MDDTERLARRLDEVPCRKRLFPARLWAVQLVAKVKIDEIIDEGLIEAIAATCGGEKLEDYRFSLATVAPGSPTPDENSVLQFLSDLRVFGLREAILFLAESEFVMPPAFLFDNCVNVYHSVAGLYMKHEPELAKPTDDLVKRLLLAMKVYGEGNPQAIYSTKKPGAAKPRKAATAKKEPKTRSGRR